MEVDSDHEAGASGGAGPSGAPSKDRKRFEVKTINHSGLALSPGLHPDTFVHTLRFDFI